MAQDGLKIGGENGKLFFCEPLVRVAGGMMQTGPSAKEINLPHFPYAHGLITDMGNS